MNVAVYKHVVLRMASLAVMDGNRQSIYVYRGLNIDTYTHTHTHARMHAFTHTLKKLDAHTHASTRTHRRNWRLRSH